MQSDLSPKMLDTLRVVADGEWMPNMIGRALGYRRGQHRTARDARVMGESIHVVSTLGALRRRGLVDLCARPDGLSGVAYYATDAGRRALS